MNTTETKTNVIELLTAYANKRPGLNFANYGDRYCYFKESREITKDLHDFRNLSQLANCLFHEEDLNERLTDYLTKSSDRLTLNEKGQLLYITGQYWSTEYRPACSRVFARVIWSYFMNLKNEDGSVKYQTGGEIRAQIKKRLPLATFKNYFN